MVVLKKTHKGWEKDVKRIRPFFNKICTGYIIPSSNVSIGSRSFKCSIETSTICKAYCCSLDVEINPLEIAIISNHKKIPPVEFVDYCENGISICNTGDSYVSPLFSLKNKSSKNKKCTFNQSDFRCGIYTLRPIVCRTMPYFLDKSLKQKKTCAGYRCGNRLTQEEFNKYYNLAKATKIFSNTYFKVDFEKWEKKKHRELLEDTFQKLEMPFYEVVANPDIEAICENMKTISNFENKLKRTKLLQEELIEILSEELINNDLTHPLETHSDLSEFVVSDEEAQC